MAYKYSDLERIKWLKNLNPNFNEQDWYGEVVVHFSHIRHLQFFRQTGTFKEKIDPAKICGIDYSYGYNCIMYKPKDWRYHWLQFFTDLRRLDRVIDNFPTKVKVIHHIHLAEEAKTVVQYGNHYFTIGGQHRLCLAKFLEVPVVEVDVIKYELDRNLFSREMRFRKIIPELKQAGFLSEDYEGDHTHDFFILEFAEDNVVIKKKYAKYVLERYATLKKMPLKGFLNYLKFTNTQYYERTRVNEDTQLYLLDTYLLKHIKMQKKVHYENP
ncbi:hypothetical protein DBR39_12735 [Chryseobacterium sp. KBW03]|uniref:hypothetical protein n=1 Tax=Bacteroidota TaxID=976 RepID=UPI000F5A40BF|nr:MULTISPECIES: hypothetical protein [Bacteroidota]RQO37750.1 hypothetical protein DBR39_12735 [Chryseobacterium sp. KBW03]